MIRFLRDWARGYTDRDIRSLQRKLQELGECTAGAASWLTVAETQALRRGHVIGIWRVSTLSVKSRRALVSVRSAANAGA